jgi:hypothetical protein
MAVTLNAVMAAGNNGDTHAVDNATSFSTTGITVAAGSNRVLIVVINWQTEGSLPASRSVTWNGAAMTEAAFNSNSADAVAVYVLVNPATGAKTLAGSWTNTNDAYVGAVCFDGADQATGINASDTATADAATIDVPGSSDGATVATFLTNGGEPTTSQTKFWGFDSLAPGGAGSYEIGGSGTVTHTFSGSGGASHAAAAVHVIAAAGGGQTVEVGQTTETDSAFALTFTKAKAVGLNTETDSALAAIAVRAFAVGQATETDSVFATTFSKAKVVGLNTETDEAFALGSGRLISVGQATETDSVFSVSRLKALVVGLATETDSALSVQGQQVVTAAAQILRRATTYARVLLRRG